MKNSLVSKVIYRTIFCTLSFITIILISDFFSMDGHDAVTFDEDFFYYYTNLSNYLCFGVMTACLCADVKQLREGQLFGHTRSPYLRHLKFITTPLIALTFLAYGILLGEPGTLSFWNSLPNICYHVICPVLFVIDTLLFDKHKSIGYLDPLLSIIPPVIYVVVIEIMGAKTGRYPYFFLDMGELGFGGLMVWVAILLSLFVAMGYILFVYDKLVKVDGKWKLDFSGTPAFGFTQKV